MSEGAGRRLADEIAAVTADWPEVQCSMGNCCRVVSGPDGGKFLSSTRRPGQFILLDADEWEAFIADVKAGRHS